MTAIFRVKTENIELCGNAGCAFNTNDKCKASNTECFGYLEWPFSPARAAISEQSN